MNKYLSILQLNIRRSLVKLLALLATFAAGELAWFAWRLSADSQMSLYAAGKVFGTCYIICMAAAALLLGWRSTKGSRPEYSLGLFAVGGRAQYIISLLYDLAAMLFAWACQIMTLYAAIRIYMTSAGYTGGPQGAIVEIYSSSALSVILPLEQSKYWIIGAVCTAVFAMAAAHLELVRTRGGFPILPLFIILITAITINTRVRAMSYSTDSVLLGFAVFWALILVVLGLDSSGKSKKEKDDYGE